MENLLQNDLSLESLFLAPIASIEFEKFTHTFYIFMRNRARYEKNRLDDFRSLRNSIDNVCQIFHFQRNSFALCIPNSRQILRHLSGRCFHKMPKTWENSSLYCPHTLLYILAYGFTKNFELPYEEDLLFADLPVGSSPIRFRQFPIWWAWSSSTSSTANRGTTNWH